MNKTDIKRMNDFYAIAKSSYKLGDSKSLSWNNKFNQLIRFEVLCKIANLDNKTIVDLGCGYGDLYFTLSQKYNLKEYIGLEIDEDYYNFATKKFKNIINAKLIKVDFFEYDYPAFDYALASGSFNFNITNAKSIYLDFIKKLYYKAKSGVAINFLREGVHDSDEVFLTFDPKLLVKNFSSYAKKVQIVEDYLDHDFTVYLYK